MSPEQVRGGAIDARSDIYSFGVTLYELLTGRKPFDADTSYSVLNAQLNQEPTPPITVNPSLPVELNNIVLRAMAKAPEARFQTAAEFREAFKSLSQSAVAAVAGVAPALVAPAVIASSASPVEVPTPPPFAPVASSNPPQAPPPGFKPVSAPAMARPAKSNRGLWIGLGALAAVLALVVAVTFLPSLLPSYVFGKPSTAQNHAAPATTPSATPSATVASAELPTAAALSQTPSTPDSAQSNAAASKPNQSANLSSRNAVLGNSQQASSSSSMANYPPPPPSGPSPAEVRKAHDQLVDLQVRGDADRVGVQHIRSEQQAMGLDLRGDILSAMGRMDGNLREAQAALDQKDLNTAQEYMNRAEHNIETLDKFLGR
jgi:serine/threonine-protein kinase